MIGLYDYVKDIDEFVIVGAHSPRPSCIDIRQSSVRQVYRNSLENKNRKTGVVITTHGNYGSTARECIQSFIDNISQPCYIILIINVSSDPETVCLEKELLENGNADVIRLIVDTGGLTKTWNIGIEKCKKAGCDTVILSNHDLYVDSSITHLISAAQSCPENYLYYYGPVTNNPGPGFSNKYQGSTRALDIDPHIFSKNGNLINLNGFLMCFPMHVLDSNKYDDKDYFNPRIRYGGNETEWFHRLESKGGKPILVPRTYVHHYKFASWRSLTSTVGIFREGSKHSTIQEYSPTIGKNTMVTQRRRIVTRTGNVVIYSDDEPREKRIVATSLIGRSSIGLIGRSSIGLIGRKSSSLGSRVDQ